MAEYLAGSATLKKVVHEAESADGLRIVWSGEPVAEPGPLLRSERFLELLGWLQRTNDWVIIDTPPIGIGDDALVVSSYSDGTLMVVRHDETSLPALDRGLSLLRTVRSPVLGIVVNRAPVERSDAYGYLSQPGVRDVASPKAGRASGLLAPRRNTGTRDG
jgi:Mrp family chromosome partitioning ATPase